MGRHFNPLFDHLKSVAIFRIQLYLILDRLIRMNNRAVVPSTKMESDRLQRTVRQLFRQVHRNLPRVDDLLLPSFCAKKIRRHVEEFRYKALNFFNGDRRTNIVDHEP